MSDEKERVRLADVGLPNSDIFLLKPGVGGLLEVLLDPWPGGVGLSSGLLMVSLGRLAMWAAFTVKSLSSRMIHMHTTSFRLLPVFV